MAEFDHRSIWQHGWNNLGRVPGWIRRVTLGITDAATAAVAAFLIAPDAAEPWQRAVWAGGGVIAGPAVFGVIVAVAWVVWSVGRGPYVQRDTARHERNDLASALDALTGDAAAASLIITRLDPEPEGDGPEWKIRSYVTNNGEPATFRVRVELPVGNVSTSAGRPHPSYGGFTSMWEYNNEAERPIGHRESGVLRLAYVRPDMGIVWLTGNPEGDRWKWMAVRPTDPTKPITATVRITDDEHNRSRRFISVIGIAERDGVMVPTFDIVDPAPESTEPVASRD